MTRSSQLTLSQLEHVFEAVNDLEAASTGELAHVSSVEEALRVYTHTHTHTYISVTSAFAYDVSRNIWWTTLEQL